MTHERYLRLMEHPELLSTISYEELKTLVLAYPYAHNLRYLLALKARQIDHPEAQRTLAAAAAYSLDRGRLFKMFMPHAVIPVVVQLEDEVLELRPIEDLRREMPERLRATQDVPFDLQQTFQAPVPEPPVSPKGNGGDNRVQWLEDSPKEPIPIVVPTEKVVEKPAAEPVIVPQKPAISFESWIDEFFLPPLVKPKLPEVEPKNPVPSIRAQDLAAKSVAENQGIISETMARMLVNQGHIGKAIAMYERLILNSPEKSAYFAAEIEKLKK